MFVEYWNGLSDEDRTKQYNKISQKYKNHIPVVVLQDENIEIDKNKYLVNNDITVGQFMFTIRKRVKLKKEEALFIVTDSGVTPPNSELMSVIYTNNKSSCGFLTLYIKKEAVFG